MQEQTNISKVNAQPASLRNFLLIIFKRKRVILTFCFTTIIVVTVASLLMPHIFQSQAKLLIEKEADPEKALLFRMNFNQGYEKYDFINSEIEILTSYPIAYRVVNNFLPRLIKAGDKELTDVEEAEQFEEIISDFQRDLDIENPKNSNILVVKYENKDPSLSTEIVNYFVNTYITYRSEISSESDTYKFFEEQMILADEKLRGLEQRQAQFKERKEVGAPETQRSILMTRMTDYEKGLTAVQTKRIGKEAKLAVINDQLENEGSLNIPSTESSDSPSREKHIAKLKGELLDMEIRKEQLLQKFTPQYKEVVDLESQIAATKTKIREEIQQIALMEEAAIRALHAEERVLTAQIEKVKNDIRNLAQNEYEYNQLSRGIAEEREIYSMLLKQREEARLSLAKLEMGVKIKVISPAITPLEPVRPKKKLNAFLSIILGILGGIGLAFFLEYFDHRINTPEELEQYTGIRSIGTLRNIEIDFAENGNGSQARRILN